MSEGLDTSSIILNEGLPSLEEMRAAMADEVLYDFLQIENVHLPEAHTGPIAESVRRVAGSYGLNQINYVLHDGPTSGFVYDENHHVILIPKGAAALPTLELDALIAHECDHFCRRDSILKMNEKLKAAMLNDDPTLAAIQAEHSRFFEEMEFLADRNAAARFGSSALVSFQTQMLSDPNLLSSTMTRTFLFPELDWEDVRGLSREAVITRIHDVMHGNHHLKSDFPLMQAQMDVQTRRLRNLQSLVEEESRGPITPAPLPVSPSSALELVDGGDPKVVELRDPKTGKHYFAKINPDTYEIDMARRASAATLPAEVDNIRIPKLVSTDTALLPETFRANAASVIIVEKAKGAVDLQWLMLARDDPSRHLPAMDGLIIKPEDFDRLEEAFRSLNQQGIYHTDLKNASNLMVWMDESGHAQFDIIDWGGPANPAMRQNDLEALGVLRQRLETSGVLAKSPTTSLADTIGDIDGREGDMRVAANAGKERVLATVPSGPHAAAERDVVEAIGAKVQADIRAGAAAERGEEVKAAMRANGGTLPGSVAVPPKPKAPDGNAVASTPNPRAAEALQPVDLAVVGHDHLNLDFHREEVPAQWRPFIEGQEASARALGVNKNDARLASLELLRVGALHTRTYHGTAHFADVAGGVEDWLGSEVVRVKKNPAILSRVAHEYRLAGGTHDQMVLGADGAPNLETTGLGRYVEQTAQGDYLIRTGVAAGDENLGIAIAAYGYKEGETLNPFNGRNEFLTTLRTLDANPGMDAQAKFSVALFHQQTIPFPAPHAVEQALKRAEKSGLFTAEDMAVRVEEMAVRGRAMAHMANHDVANFTHARDVFRGNTINLLLEVPEGDLGIPSLLADRAHKQAGFFEGLATRLDRGEAVIFRTAPSMSPAEVAAVAEKNVRARAQITESIADMRALVAAADPEFAREKGIVVDDAERARGADIHAEAKARWQAHITQNPDRAPTLVAKRVDNPAALGDEVLARHRIAAAEDTLGAAHVSGSGVFDRGRPAHDIAQMIAGGNVTVVRPSRSGVHGTAGGASAAPLRLPSPSDTGGPHASLAQGATNASPAVVANDPGHAAVLNPRSNIKPEEALARPPEALRNAAEKFVISGRAVVPPTAANDAADAVADAGRAIGAVSDEMKALHGIEALGALRRTGKLVKPLAQKIPAVGLGLAAGFGAYALWHAEQGHNEGKLSDEHIRAVRKALLPYVGTQAGSIVTGVAGEEAVDAALIYAGVPQKYRLGTLRDGIASGAHMLEEMNKFNARKLELPAPVVADFIRGLSAVRGKTEDLALNDFFAARDLAIMEHRDGRVQSVSSQARFGDLPRSPVSVEEMKSRIEEAARTYLALGGSLETAQFALAENPEIARAQAMIQDVINLVPSRGTHAFPTADKNLEALKKLKQQGEARPADQPALMQQMVAAAAEYVKAGGTARDALVSYYHAAPFGLSPETVKQLEGDKAMLKLMDGSDGTKANGKLTPIEIAQGLVNLGVYNPKLDVDHSGQASYTEIKAAVRNPAEFQAQRNNPSSSRVR